VTGLGPARGPLRRQGSGSAGRQVTEENLDDLQVVATYLAGSPTYEA